MHIYIHTHTHIYRYIHTHMYIYIKLGAFEMSAAKFGEGGQIENRRHVTNRPYKFDLCNVICLKNGQIFGLGSPPDLRGALISSAPSFTYTYTYTHTYVPVHIHIHIHMYLYIYIYTYICTCPNHQRRAVTPCAPFSALTVH